MVEGGASTLGGGGAIDTGVRVVKVEAEVSNDEMIFECTLVGGAAVAAARRAASHGL
jgi:hypothetical protein